MGRSHTTLSPSNSHRWLVCTPSAILEREFPDSRSESAEEGTVAHDLAEVELSRFLGRKTERQCDRERATIKRRKNADGGTYWGASMGEYVDEYVSIVTEKFMDAQERDPAATLLLERQLDLTEWVPGGSGYCDAVIVANGTMEVIDFKYGQKVRVDAEDNPQLRLYALGAYASLSWLYDISHAVMTIVQPRNGGVSSEKLRIGELLTWGDSIKPVAKLAAAGEGETVAGEHCTFCRVAPRCKRLAEYHQEIARHRFANPDLLSDEDIADILGRLDDLTGWANKVKEYALSEARDRKKKWPGWKLVEGKSNRKLTDEGEAMRLLEEAGYTEAQYLKPKEIQGFTNLEKLVGRKKLAELLKSVIVKPPGKPTLAPEDDPRPEFNSAKEAFKPVAEGEDDPNSTDNN